MNLNSQNVSEFACLLRRLLDETDIFSRSKWAKFLRVSEAAISQWVTDKTVPRAELLRMIVDLVRSVDGAPHEILRTFDEMATKPALSISPHGKRIGESVSAYLVSPLLDGFLLDLKGLKPEKQRRVLLKSSMLCAEETGLYKPPVAPVYEVANRVPSGTAHGGAATLDLYKSADLYKRAEAAVTRIEENIPAFLFTVMKYLTSTPDEGLLPEVRTFCVHAIARVRTQKNTKPMMLISTIIESKVIDPSLFDRLWEREALNALFLADEGTAILVHQPDGPVRLLHRLPTDLEQDVATLSGFEVQYIPLERVQLAYRHKNIGELEDVA